MNTPKNLRIQIGIFGRRNVGKSSIMNMLSMQNASIVSDTPGTTTDVVEKSIEIHGFGAALLIDTAGIDDVGELGYKRIQKTYATLDSIDIAILVSDGKFCKFEKELILKFQKLKKPFLVLANKTDLGYKLPDKFAKNYNVILTSTKTKQNLDAIFAELVKLKSTLDDETNDMFDSILKQGQTVLLITPIDDEAPKNRLILPQVQAIRQILDHDAFAFVSKDSNVSKVAQKLKPDLIVCDSQCVLEVVKTAPNSIAITTFSVLMSRIKGDLNEFLNGAKTIKSLKENDKILIAEACTHNAKDGDIARVKIPKLLQNFSNKALEFYYTNGKDYPQNLCDFALIVHCGGCMINKNNMQSRNKRQKMLMCQ